VKKDLLIELVCLAGESKEIIIRCQAQALFTFFLRKILTLKLPYREEVEVMYIKLVLKPLEVLGRRPVGADQDASNSSSGASSARAKPKEEKCLLSDTQEDEVVVSGDKEQHVLQPDGHSTDSFSLDINLAFLTEVLLCLTPQQIG